MKLALDYTLRMGEQTLMGSAVQGNPQAHLSDLRELPKLTGDLVIQVNGKELRGDFSDPILLLAGGWLRKLPWILGGDTETVALRNSAHCFAFTPAGDAVEIAFYVGDEAEIEEYVIEPFNVRLADFATESIRWGEGLLKLIKAVDPGLVQSNEDCQDLAASLDVARNAWRDAQRQRR